MYGDDNDTFLILVFTITQYGIKNVLWMVISKWLIVLPPQMLDNCNTKVKIRETRMTAGVLKQDPNT